MRTTGKIVLWLGIIFIALMLLVGGFLIATSVVADEPEILGWTMILGMFFGIPALVASGILILIGAVLITSAPKPSGQETAPPPKRPSPPTHIAPNKSRYWPASTATRDTEHTNNEALRSSLKSGTSKLHTLAFLVRVTAVIVFVWLFVPEAYNSITLYSYMANIDYGTFALVIAFGFVMAAVIPLILWLVSNLIKSRAHIADGHLA